MSVQLESPRMDSCATSMFSNWLWSLGNKHGTLRAQVKEEVGKVILEPRCKYLGEGKVEKGSSGFSPEEGSIELLRARK